MEIDAAIREIAEDNRSGATALAERAAAILEEAAGRPGEGLAAAALALARAQPAMAPLLRVGNDALLAAEGDPAGAAEAAREAVRSFAANLAEHGERAAAQGALLLRGVRRVLTHSASSLVFAALRRAHAEGAAFEVVCTESRPAHEGAYFARRLGEGGIRATLVIDAAAAALLPHCDLVLLGADTLCAGGLVHKVGTLGIAVAARHQGVPVYALATDEKLLPKACGARPPIPERSPEELLPLPSAGVRALNFAFDLTPRRCLSGIVTEQGLLPDKQVSRRLREIPVHPALRGLWAGSAGRDLLP